MTPEFLGWVIAVSYFYWLCRRLWALGTAYDDDTSADQQSID